MKGALTSAALSLLGILLTRRSSAAEPSAGLLGGLAFMEPGWSFGARGGVALERVYVGGTFLYHPAKLFPEAVDSFWYGGIEGGFETGTFPKTRAYLGAGYGVRREFTGGVSADNSIQRTWSSKGSFVAWPGIAVLFPIDPFFLGVDVRLILWTRPDHAGSINNLFTPSGHLTAGAVF